MYKCSQSPYFAIQVIVLRMKEMKEVNWFGTNHIMRLWNPTVITLIDLSLVCFLFPVSAIKLKLQYSEMPQQPVNILLYALYVCTVFNLLATINILSSKKLVTNANR